MVKINQIKGLVVYKSYTDLERENVKLQEGNRDLQRKVLYLQHVIQELNDSIENKNKQIRDRDTLLVAFKNRLESKKHWWQRIKQDKYAPKLLDMIEKVWSKAK